MTAIFANNRAPQAVQLTNGKLFTWLHSKEIVTDEETIDELRTLAEDTKNYGHIIEMRKWTVEDVMAERGQAQLPASTIKAQSLFLSPELTP